MNILSKHFYCFCLLVSVFSLPSLWAQTAIPEWVSTKNTFGEIGLDIGKAIHRDQFGNLLAYGELNYLSNRPTLLLRKFDSNNNLLWETEYHTTQPLGSSLQGDRAIDVKSDAQGNIFTLSNSLISNNSNTDILLRKYDPNGTLLWSVSYDDLGGHDEAKELHIDQDGIAIVFGVSRSLNSNELILLRYTRSGRRRSIYRRSAPNFNQKALDMIVQDNGQIALLGGPQNGQSPNLSLSLLDAGGNEIWDRLIGTNLPSGEYYTGNEIKQDSMGNTFLLTFLQTPTARKAEVFKFSQTGIKLDAYQFSPCWGDIAVLGMEVDAQGQVYFVYRCRDQLFSGPWFTPKLAKLDTNLDLLWEVNLDSLETQYMPQQNSLQWSPNGNLIIVGLTDLIHANRDSKILCLEYSTSGSQINAIEWDRPSVGWEQVSEFEVGPQGKIWITGISSLSTSDHDFATISIDPSNGADWLDIKKGFENADDLLTGMAVDYNDHVWLIGRAIETDTDHSIAHLAKYDPSGSMVWDTILDSEGQYVYPGSLLADGAGNVYATIGKHNSLSYLYQDSLKLIKFSPQGTILWKKSVPQTGNFEFEVNPHLTEGTNGDIYVTTNLLQRLNGLPSVQKWQVSSFDHDGNLNWDWQSPVFTNSPTFTSGSVTHQGGIAVGGLINNTLAFRVLDSTGNLITSFDHIRPSAGKVQFTLDHSGNVIFSSNVWLTPTLNSSTLVKYDPSGNLLFEKDLDVYGMKILISAGVKCDAIGNIYINGRKANRSLAIKFDPNGNLIWDKVFGFQPSARISDILPTANGEFFLTGRIPTANNSQALVSKYDPSGNLIWRFLPPLGEFIDSEGLFLAHSSGGDLYMAGTAIHTLTGHDFVLIKFSQLVDRPEPREKVFTLLPNPCQDRLEIRLPKPIKGGIFQVLDLQGRVLIQQKASTTIEPLRVDVSGLISGFYLMRLQLPNGLATTQKFIVEKFQ